MWIYVWFLGKYGEMKKKKKIIRTCTLAEMGMGMRPSDWEICLSCSGNLISGNINHGYCSFFFFFPFSFFCFWIVFATVLTVE